MAFRDSSIRLRRDGPVLILSLALHFAVFLGLAMVTIANTTRETRVAIESIFENQDRSPQEFTQELNADKDIAESLNVIGGGGSVLSISAGMAGGGGAGGGPSVQQVKIDQAGSMKDPVIVVNGGDINLPGIESLGNDLGSGQIAGEVGAVVEGYGAALDRVTQELIRLMREQKILVVWLFDESESMKDDQEDLRGRVRRVYEELKLVDDAQKEDVLLTAIVSFGKEVHFQLPKHKPTDDTAALMRAIDAIPIDKSGVENTCHAIMTAINEYKKFQTSGRRKMVLICVSDESGDDGDKAEEALRLAKSTGTAIFFMGRESVFGNLYSYVTWQHPQTGGTHYLPIRRGPETPYAELLQFDGFRRRMDSAMSGFGPYEQVRLSRDSGGIFFILPSEEQNLNEFDSRKYAALDLKPYEPDIGSRRQYVEERDHSPLRKAVWETIVMLNAHDEKTAKEISIPIDNWYGIRPDQYTGPVNSAMAQCLRTFEVLSQAERHLKAVEKTREKETSARWRANYDLMLGQVMAYRVRLFQYTIALDQYSKSMPTRKLTNPMSNQWAVGIGARELLKPDEQQLKNTKVTVEDLDKARQAAQSQFTKVIKEHPSTPWAQRAAWELGRNYGMYFAERYVPPPPKNPPPPPKTPIAPPPNL